MGENYQLCEAQHKKENIDKTNYFFFLLFTDLFQVILTLLALDETRVYYC